MSDPQVDPRLELDRLVARLAEAEAPLDDLARVRAEARLEAALDAEQAGGAPAAGRTPGRRRRVVAAVLLAAAAAAAALLVWSRRPGGTAAPGEAAARVEPFLVSPLPGGAPSPAAAAPPAAALREAGDRLDVPAGWLVRATVGEQVTITALGPAALRVDGGQGSPTIQLERGRLLATLDPSGGTGRPRLRVVAAGSEVLVVGTLFAVETDGSSSQVSVRHGRVRVRGAAGEVEVPAGRTWRSDRASSPAPIAADVAGWLDEHERILPPTGATVPVFLAGEPSGAEVWLDGERVATTPAWLRLPGGTSLRLSAPGFVAGDVIVTDAPVGYRLAPDPGAKQAAEQPRPAPPPPPSPPSPPPPPPSRAPARTQEAPPEPKPPAAGPPVEPAVEPVPDAAALYREADRALAAADHDGARAALLEVLRRFPDDPLADAAGFDLASMALAAGELDAAARYLGGIDDPSLAEPRAYLGCRIELARRAGGAADCLADFRLRYPGSAHDADALGQLAALRYDQGGCAGAHDLLAEYTRRYPHGPAAAPLRARLERCASPAATPR